MLKAIRHRLTRILALVAMAVFAAVPAGAARGCECQCCGSAGGKADAGPDVRQAGFMDESCCCGTYEGGCCGQDAIAALHKTLEASTGCKCIARQGPLPANGTGEQTHAQKITDSPVHSDSARWPVVDPSLLQLSDGIGFHPAGPPVRELYCVWRN